MIFAAEYITHHLFQMLPGAAKEKVNGWITALRLRAAREVPLTEVAVFSFTEDSRARFPTAEPIPDGLVEEHEPASLIITVRNEASSIAELLSGLAAQTALPEEVLIVDGGSSDDTVPFIRRWIESSAPRSDQGDSIFRLIEAGESSIAKGRNIGVAEASYDLLLFTDAGCAVDRRWAERLRTPFALDPSLELAMGFYVTVPGTLFSREFVRLLVPRIETVDPARFLPSARSVAVRRECFDAVGGFPEHLTDAGEDTLFDIYLKTLVVRAAFVPDAIVTWRPPDSVGALARAAYRYARGDAEAGVLYRYYLDLLSSWWGIAVELLLAYVLSGIGTKMPQPAQMILRVIGLVLVVTALVRFIALVGRYRPFRGVADLKTGARRALAVALLVTSQAAGFLRGLAARRETERRRIAAARGHCVVFSNHALVRGDIAEADWLRQLFEGGWYVVHVYVGAPPLPLFQHPRFEQHSRGGFSPELWWAKHQQFFSGTRALRFEDRIGDATSSFIRARLEALRSTPAER